MTIIKLFNPKQVCGGTAIQLIVYIYKIGQKKTLTGWVRVLNFGF